MSAEPVKVYDLVEVTCNLGGIPLDALGGWGEGDGTIEIERDSDDFNDTVGADGTVVRSKTYDDRATVTLNLLQTAGANKILSTLRQLDHDQPNGAGIVPFLILDRQGLSQIDAKQAWLKGPPKKITFGPKAGTVQWQVRLGKANIFLGGN